MMIVLPDFPDTWKALSEEERHVATRRLAIDAAEVDVDEDQGMGQLRGIKLALTDPKTYLLAVAVRITLARSMVSPTSFQYGFAETLRPLDLLARPLLLSLPSKILSSSLLQLTEPTIYFLYPSVPSANMASHSTTARQEPQVFRTTSQHSLRPWCQTAFMPFYCVHPHTSLWLSGLSRIRGSLIELENASGSSCTRFPSPSSASSVCSRFSGSPAGDSEGIGTK